MTAWSVVLYFFVQSEIIETADEELENQKRLIIQKMINDSIVVTKEQFDENQYVLSSINEREILQAKDQYVDTMIYMQDADDESLELEPVRMLVATCNIKGRHYRLRVVSPVIEQSDLIKALFWNIAGLYLIITLSIVVVNGMILKKLWHPFYTFLDRLKAYKIGESKPIRNVDTQIEEFIDLQQTVSEMNKHSLKAFNRQKEFIENASHELQTPLAIANNKFELLFESEQLQDTQAEKINEIYQILQRLTRLNKSLLLLSKIENNQFTTVADISINKRIFQIRTELQEYIHFKNINFMVLEEETVSQKMDVILVDVLFGNLIRNAIFHNKENGIVELSLTKNSFVICNTGNEVSLNEDNIFNRFQKSDASTKGSGLGLSIVKAIADAYHMKVSYCFCKGKHWFKIIFNNE
ncbi:MAG: histidine kinase dimerization/phospho-acceptor domain-containing protein [Mangrovibacterium sp.]